VSIITAGSKCTFVCDEAAKNIAEPTPFVAGMINHSGQVVTVVRKMNTVVIEAYLVRASDGWEFSAFAEELEPVR